MSKLRNQKGFGLVEIILIILFLCLMGLMICIYVQSKEKDKAAENNTSKSRVEKAKSSKESEESPVKYGIIKGHASYPSEMLPEDEEVCAENINDPVAAPICINVGKAQIINYELKVPTGEYYVYARSGNLPNYKAYYNEFVKCGASVDCPEAGHKQYIKVTVGADAVVENVDPGDWYAN